MGNELNRASIRSVSANQYIFNPDCVCTEEPHRVSDHLKHPSLQSLIAETETGLCTIPLAVEQQRSLTDLTLRAVEAAGTGTDVGLNAGSSIQTDWVTQSCGRHKEPRLHEISVFQAFSSIYSIWQRKTSICFAVNCVVMPTAPA